MIIIFFSFRLLGLTVTGHKTRYMCSTLDDSELKDFLLSKRPFRDLRIDLYLDAIYDEEDRKQVKRVINLYYTEKYNLGLVPTFLSVNRMQNIMYMPDSMVKEAFSRYFTYEYKRYLWIKKKNKNHYEYRENEPTIHYNEETGAPYYGIWKNTYFPFLRKVQIRLGYVFKACEANLFGQRLIIDCDYYHARRYIPTLAITLADAICGNYKSSHPFKLTVTGYTPQSYFGQEFNSMNVVSPNLFDLVDYRPNSFIDYFKNEKLVYLSAYSPYELKEFDKEATYIIGCYTTPHQHTSLEKSNKYGLPNYKFPTEYYHTVHTSTNFPTGLATKILCSYAEHGDFRKSLLDNIPKRMHASRGEKNRRDNERNRFSKTNAVAAAILKDPYNISLEKS